MYKQVILIREDLKLSKGKIAAQCAHASYSSAKKSKNTVLDEWESEGQKKVVLGVKDLTELKKIKKSVDSLKIPNALIIDAGKTEIDRGTITALGIGPDKEEKINKATGNLKLLK